jgi:hypothetical protein
MRVVTKITKGKKLESQDECEGGFYRFLRDEHEETQQRGGDKIYERRAATKTETNEMAPQTEPQAKRTTQTAEESTTRKRVNCKEFKPTLGQNV